jgi:hypothetical protein
VTWAWEHNEDDAQWELRSADRVQAWVTDEFIAKVADRERVAVHVFNKIGSVPPLLAAYLPTLLPPPVNVVWESCEP